MQSPKCLRCGGEMRQGFVKDSSTAGMFPTGYLPRWHAGAPTFKFFSGLKGSGGEPLPVGAYRCVTCGWLDFYAATRFEAH